MKKVVLYLRVSTSDQDARMQMDELRDYCAARKFKVIDEVAEQISAGKENRPGYNRVIELARKRKVDAVLVWKFDRFARSTRELIDSLETFRDLGVDFLSLQENIDTSTPTGKAVFTIISAIAELERETIRIRVKAGIEKAKRHGTKSGRPMGNQPLPKAVISNVRALIEKGVAPVEIRRRLGISKTSYYRIARGEHVSMAAG